MIGITFIILVFNYFYFFKSGRGQRIATSRPMFFSSKKISTILTAVFFVVLISSLFW